MTTVSKRWLDFQVIHKQEVGQRRQERWGPQFMVKELPVVCGMCVVVISSLARYSLRIRMKTLRYCALGYWPLSSFFSRRQLKQHQVSNPAIAHARCHKGQFDLIPP
jgi:hypothetical protein